jgi:hypothetical protein
MAPEVSFAKAQEITDTLSRECSMASHTAAPLVAGLKRFVEHRILPNGALDHITEHGFRLPADEVGALLDRYRWPHDAKRQQVMCILRKALEAVAELRSTSDAAVRGSESIEEARLILNHSHERLVRTIENVLDEHAKRADPTLVLGQNLFVAVSRVPRRTGARAGERPPPAEQELATLALSSPDGVRRSRGEGKSGGEG